MEKIRVERRAVQLRLKPELHDWVHSLSKEQDRSANWIINKVLEDAKGLNDRPREVQQ